MNDEEYYKMREEAEKAFQEAWNKAWMPSSGSEIRWEDERGTIHHTHVLEAVEYELRIGTVVILEERDYSGHYYFAEYSYKNGEIRWEVHDIDDSIVGVILNKRQ